MPELPEVETTVRGIRPHIINQRVTDAAVRQRKLRQPVTRNLAGLLQGQAVQRVERRAKYLLIYLSSGCLIVHLGMSGSLSILTSPVPPGKHDHVDIGFSNKHILRFNDPRRFGCVLYTPADPMDHKLIKNLGPEPFDKTFSGAYLHQLSRKRKVAVKNFIMNGHIVMGVRNIYASEALFRAGILPHRQAGHVSLERYESLHKHIVVVLNAAIEKGGTTLQDFFSSDGTPGYFQQKLNVYGREGKPCRVCGAKIKVKVIGQRSSFYCTGCQR